MPLNLKTTIVASSALAAVLNLAQFAGSYNQRAIASFEPNLAEAAPAHPSAGPAATRARTVAAPTTPAATAAPTTPTPAAASDPVTTAQTRLRAAGLKPEFAASYLAVQAKTGTPWQLLAAVHRIETGQRGDTAITSYAGALGPMQFMPATFAHYAQDGDANGTTNINDFDDSVLTAGRYLAANGAAKGNYQNALYRYNHSNVYVANVLAIAQRLGL